MNNDSCKQDRVYVVNASFSEMDHLAAALCKQNELSAYIRPYTNKQRVWEVFLEKLPFIKGVYRNSLGRRRLVEGLDGSKVSEAAVFLDVLMAFLNRLSLNGKAIRKLRRVITMRRNRSVAETGGRRLGTEKIVIASWGCAEPVFAIMKRNNGICILNYSIAHHRYTKKILQEEAKRVPEFSDSLNSHDWPEWLENRFDREIEMADKILVGSSFVKKSFLSEGIPEEKLIVIPYGTDISLFSPKKENHRIGDTVNILFVGQIGQRKGLSYLFEAYRKIQRPNTRLTLVGKIQGNGRALLKYRNLFRHIPHIPKNKLVEVYQTSDIFLFPTLIEGMPLVVLEAMASGLPVVTTENGPGDIVRDGVDGFIVPGRDPEATANRLQKLVADKELRERMGQNARNRAMNYTWQNYRNNVITKLIEEGYVNVG